VTSEARRIKLVNAHQLVRGKASSIAKQSPNNRQTIAKREYV